MNPYWTILISVVLASGWGTAQAAPMGSSPSTASRGGARTTGLEPDVIPALSLRGWSGELGRYLTVYYASGSRMAPGASIVGIPFLREVRSGVLDLKIDSSGQVVLPTLTFSRTTQNRVNWVVLLGSDKPLGVLTWANADGSCPIGIGLCSSPRGAASMAVVPVDGLIQLISSSEGGIDASTLLRKVRRGAGN